ncbi:methyltransferase domain-containing protein [Terrabacter sp. GCM10028922]|uniref:methyltransferase domain-containing protein n=1 Tax=Terrabacter sp. GCM10028922 TaxID=3273428 RepID=UPI00360F6754
MTQPAREQLEAFLHDGDRAIWSTAALVLALQDAASEEQHAAAHAVLEASGLDGVASLGADEAGGLAAQAAAPVHQVAGLLRGEGQMWAAQSDEALIAQGRASARGAAGFAEFGLPMLAGLGEAFADGARMLDVGTGVGAMAVAYAQLFPHLTVVGIDVLPRVLALAAQTVAASSVGDRVILREQDVSSLDETETYAFAWVPAPFLPASALAAGVPRVGNSLRVGGWLMLGHGKYGGSAVNDAVGRFKTIAYGGTALNDEEAEEMLRSAGLVEVRTVPTPHGSPAISVGRRPPAA